MRTAGEGGVEAASDEAREGWCDGGGGGSSSGSGSGHNVPPALCSSHTPDRRRRCGRSRWRARRDRWSRRTCRCPRDSRPHRPPSACGRRWPCTRANRPCSECCKHTHTHTHTRTHTRTHAHTHTRTHAHTYTHTCIFKPQEYDTEVEKRRQRRLDGDGGWRRRRRRKCMHALTFHEASGAATNPARRLSCRSRGTGDSQWGSHGTARSGTT